MKNLTLIYVLALTVIALVISASQFLVQRSINTNLYDSRTINISGRQSMLSQKISRAALMMRDAQDEVEYETVKLELNESTHLWERSHNALQYGDDELELNNINNSDQTLLYFLELEPHYVAIRQSAGLLNDLDFNHPKKDSLAAEYVYEILDSQDDFQQLMDRITLDYDTESRGRITELSRIEYILLAIALGLLVLEALLIFRPMIGRIVLATKKLLRQEESLKRSLKETEEERDKVEFLNKQAESVFDNVKQGIFLLNNKYQISELYSNASEEIFEQKDLGGKNFVKIMKPRLLQRDQKALDMFIGHLFNPEIKEKMLTKLNPVSQVEFYASQEGADIQTKYINISFSRVGDKKNIIAVLVTVSDETSTVLMQKKIAESEEKNKKDSEQLLSILRVESLALTRFLDDAKESLSSISKKYESDPNSNLKELVTFTFNIIHKLKGNASAIDLEIVENKFHEVEDVLVKLRDKVDLSGKDFLKILYMVNEINLILVNMQRMLLRISDVNQAHLVNPPVGMKGTLEKGLEKLCDQGDVAVRLDYNDYSTVLPDRYRFDIQDITIQLFRNTIAHGIESKEIRQVLGKPDKANIKVSIKIKNDHIIYKYLDDGSGLDTESILDKALSKGIISEKEALKMPENKIYSLIFRDDFSTNQRVDKLSGRGQGMGVIRSILKKNDGKYKISSVRGVSFSMTIKMPLITELTEF